MESICVSYFCKKIGMLATEVDYISVIIVQLSKLPQNFKSYLHLKEQEHRLVIF